MDNKSLKYWERRKAQRMWEHMQSAEDTADQISLAYYKSSGYINHELDNIYDRFKAKHQLSNAEAKRLLNLMQDRTSIDDLKQALKQSADSDEKKELLKLIESPAYSSRIQRLQELQQEVDVLMRNQYHLEKERSTRHYTNLINESYYKSIYDIQKDTGLAFSFNHVSPKLINSVLHSNWSGANYSQRIWDNTQALAQNLKEELLINVLTGRSDREVAEIISNKFDSGAMEARRLVRTESNYIANEMECQSYEECGIEKYVYVATLDKKTSKICRELDMKKFKVKDRQPGKNCPPMHPWCRSTTISYLDDEILESMERRARDPETGEVYKVPGNMSYKKWYEEKVEGNSSKEVAEKAWKNKNLDKEQYAKYKNVYRGDKNFDSFDSYQKMKYNESNKWQGYKDTLKSTEMKNFISDSGYEYIGEISDKEVIVKPAREIKVSDLSQHAYDNLDFKVDRKEMTTERAQNFVNNSKLVLYRKSNHTFKYLSQNGYSVLNEKDELVTAVPQKWRKKYDNYLEKE